jgi:hypothetical protein
MPIIFSYDLENAQTTDHNRMQSMFERFGWERIGGSCYRYPTLPKAKKNAGTSTSKASEDWLNQVVPALMCFRAYVLYRSLKLTKHSLDAQTSTGSHGAQPQSGAELRLDKLGNKTFGAKLLRDWVDTATRGFPPHY